MKEDCGSSVAQCLVLGSLGPTRKTAIDLSSQLRAWLMLAECLLEATQL